MLGVFVSIKNFPASSKNDLLCYKKFGYEMDFAENCAKQSVTNLLFFSEIKFLNILINLIKKKIFVNSNLFNFN